MNATNLAALLPSIRWPPVKGGQPNRVPAPPEATAIIEAILAEWFKDATFDRRRACLSRLVPGATYEMHRDPQPPGWITRVHVPVVTNPEAWLCFEVEGRRVHFEAGKAYTFDTHAMHNYGNDGDADRVHLIFDVLRNDGTP